MNLEVWYSLVNTKVSDLEKLEKVIQSLSYKHRLKLLFKPFKETLCPHQKAAYVLLKWAEKEYLGLIVLKRILALEVCTKDALTQMADSLGLCATQVKDLFESEDYLRDLEIDYVESKEFFIDQTTLMIGEDHLISLSLESDQIKEFIDHAYLVHTKKIKPCAKIHYCSDEQCQFHKQGVQEEKCK
jgi:predicted DsbA family dithiol-disulfide isomerase